MLIGWEGGEENRFVMENESLFQLLVRISNNAPLIFSTDEKIEPREACEWEEPSKVPINL